ncbi:MAG TPA: MBL fold metallo-hydrolase [Ideonella sp.]|uniref:MBL fold metallo-hydrolase n=1 Tax=Ideonella sp. TaxID=1929293 RepID=UPI002BC188CF|nr:MBL fold metallo-hydrolase [Ideonella sp.]HSI48660.1 MBL fold metallo-hydrolase [Ideonella sp.]
MPSSNPTLNIKKILTGSFVVFIACAVVASVAAWQSFTPASLRLDDPDVGVLPPALPPSAMSVTSLPTGSYDSPAALTFRGGSWRETRHMAMTQVLIRHPKGNLLIDAGAGTNVDSHVLTLPAMQRTPYRRGTPAIEQLAALGMKPGDVAGVIPTHAHWDHISGLQDLKDVPVLISDRARMFIASETEDTKLLRSFQNVRFIEYKFDGGSYLGFPRSHDVWGDGSVVIVPAPGHTPDSVVVFVNLPSGKRLAFLGDLTFQMEGIDLPAEKPWMMRRIIGERDNEVRHDIALIRAAREKYPQIIAIAAHDSKAFQAIPVAPSTLR